MERRTERLIDAIEGEIVWLMAVRDVCSDREVSEGAALRIDRMRAALRAALSPTQGEA